MTVAVSGNSHSVMGISWPRVTRSCLLATASSAWLAGPLMTKYVLSAHHVAIASVDCLHGLMTWKSASCLCGAYQAAWMDRQGIWDATASDLAASLAAAQEHFPSFLAALDRAGWASPSEAVIRSKPTRIHSG